MSAPKARTSDDVVGTMDYNAFIAGVSDESCDGSVTSIFETEIGTYEQVIFPPRPAGLEAIGRRSWPRGNGDGESRYDTKECEKFNTIHLF